MTVLRSFIAPLPLAAELAGERHARDSVERVEDALTLDGRRLEEWDARGPAVKDELQIVHGRQVRQIALVVLKYIRNLVERRLVFAELQFQIAQALHVLAQAVELRVGDEHKAVSATEDQPPRGVVVDLARHRVELEAGLESAHGERRYRQEIEIDRPVVASRERDHVPAIGVGRGRGG